MSTQTATVNKTEKRVNVRYLTVTAMLSAVAYILMFHDAALLFLWGYFLNQLSYFNLITPKTASPKMLLFILLVPNTRFIKIIGTSTNLKPDAPRPAPDGVRCSSGASCRCRSRCG